MYLLERMADEGHVYAPFEYLEQQFESGLEMDARAGARARSRRLQKAVRWSSKPAGEHTAVYLKRLHEAEVTSPARFTN